MRRRKALWLAAWALAVAAALILVAAAYRQVAGLAILAAFMALAVMTA